MVIPCLDNWNTEPVRLWPTNPDPRRLFLAWCNIRFRVWLFSGDKKQDAMRNLFVWYNCFFLYTLVGNLKNFQIIQRSATQVNTHNFLNPCPSIDKALCNRFESFNYFYISWSVKFIQTLTTDIRLWSAYLVRYLTNHAFSSFTILINGVLC